MFMRLFPVYGTLVPPQPNFMAFTAPLASSRMLSLLVSSLSTCPILSATPFITSPSLHFFFS